jgi:hypothetical protein
VNAKHRRRKYGGIITFTLYRFDVEDAVDVVE